MDYSLIWRRRADDPTRKSEIPAKPLKEMVGATGIEPVTPTMSMAEIRRNLRALAYQRRASTVKGNQ
jgi:hypothetical protein